MEVFFQAAHVVPNLRTYPRLFVEVYTWWPLAGFVVGGLAVVAPRRLGEAGRPVALAALAVIALNIAVYLPYLPYDQWPLLRFFLPATTALVVLFAAAATRLAAFAWSRPRVRWTALAAPVVVTMVIANRPDLVRYALDDWRAQARIPAMGHYLREALSREAVVLSFIHSGAAAHYTGRNVVQLERIDPASLDRVVDDLARCGLEPVFVIDDLLEAPQFRERFQGSRFAALDWAPRAQFTSVSTIRYLVAGDLERQSGGERWPIDVVR